MYALRSRKDQETPLFFSLVPTVIPELCWQLQRQKVTLTACDQG